MLLTPKAELDAAKNPTEAETEASGTEAGATESESSSGAAAASENPSGKQESAPEDTEQVPGRTKKTGIGPGYED